MFVLRRLSSALPTLFAVSLLVFLFVDLIPGDPAQILAGPTASNEEIESIRKFLGLNEPLLSRYGRTHRPVVVELADISMPIYWLGLLCIWYFAVNLGWLPAAGASTPMHFVLPILVIATRPAAMFSRLVATSLTESMGRDYLDTARAKGLSETRVVLFHALRNSLIAAVSVAGVQFGGMLGGSVVTETVFGIPGVGRLLVDAVSRADYPVIQYAILMFAVFFVAINLVTDLLTQWLDPRTRDQERLA